MAPSTDGGSWDSSPYTCTQMEVDCPYPKRRRLAGSALWEEEALQEECVLWTLCDAVALYASESPVLHGSTAGFMEASGSRRGVGGFGELQQSARVAAFAATAAPSPPALVSRTFSPPFDGSPLHEVPPASPSTVPSSASAACLSSASAGSLPMEPLLRALTRLANAAAAGTGVRRQLVAECQVHAPLLRLMQRPWALQPLVAERCLRLLHWLCTRSPENREVLAAFRGACVSNSGGARSVSFVEAVLGVTEVHPRCREVLAHALRALVALLPSPSVREELTRSQSRLLTCLVFAGEALDVTAVRAVCRWLPGLSGEVRRAFSREGQAPCAVSGSAAPQLSTCAGNAASPLPAPHITLSCVGYGTRENDTDVQMALL
eukprot:TRINITY_DN67944_c0_g1_i1.p1 TRINITY_DN67944_c0_g1~~TRINITY_DN67944_c0_g1_i1.p1  ORF type:complete len:377 (-),score=70.21 TRINITY_DN67944_c0_g1_i1:57-1187(-)